MKYLARNNISLSRTTIQTILKKNLRLYPYKKKQRPKLTDTHREHRIDTAKVFQEGMTEDPNPWLNVAFTDECRFHPEPKPNRQNDVIWDDQPDDEKHYTSRSKYAGQSVEVGCHYKVWLSKIVLY